MGGEVIDIYRERERERGRENRVKEEVWKKFSQKTVCRKVQKCRFYFLFISLPWLSNKLLWSVNKLPFDHDE